MKASHLAQQRLQRDYYAATADRYDQLHVSPFDEHQIALAWLKGMIELLDVKSILDIGSGTGRGVLALKAAFPHLKVVGVEPSPELRAQGHAKGLDADDLVDGDVHALAYPDGAFDIVCEFATLHHVPDPRHAVAEMLRVARVAIFISDSNVYGQGPAPVRLARRILARLGLWRAFDRLKTGGKGYRLSDGDGLSYAYSVFDNHAQVREACAAVHVMNTRPGGINPRATAAAVAMLGLKGPGR